MSPKRVWDVVDRTLPNDEITQIQQRPRGDRFIICSAVKVVLGAVLVVGSAGSAADHTSSQVVVVNQFRSMRADHQRANGSRAGTDEIDSRVGRSTKKLAGLFPAFFRPAPPEEDDSEDDYSFS